MATTTPSQIDPKLLEILRCPVAVHYTDQGDDPGKLELVRDYWLVSKDSGYKYPIIDGIPKMLIEEGARWKDTAVDDLPVPPPNDPVYTVAEEALPPELQEAVSKLNTQAGETRTAVIKQLDETAQRIRMEAKQADSDTVTTRAEEVAIGLEQAARLVERGSTPSIQAPAQNGLPWRLLAFMLVLGLVLGLILRGGKKN